MLTIAGGIILAIVILCAVPVLIIWGCMGFLWIVTRNELAAGLTMCVVCGVLLLLLVRCVFGR